MARTTRELWLEDRQGVLDRQMDGTWWRWLHWCTSIGLLLAVVQWGWVAPTVLVLAGVVVSVLVFLACLGRVDLARVRLVADLSATACLAAVGGAGLIAVSATAGLVVVVVLTLTSPVVRRSLRAARTARRLSGGGPGLAP